MNIHHGSCSLNKVIDAALDFFHRGFVPIPLNAKSKKAARNWKELQLERPTEHEVQRSFEHLDNPGIGIVMGPASNGLYARDFDSHEAHNAWAVAHPELSHGRLPVVETKRGKHVWFRSKTRVRTARFSKHDGDLLGFGRYAVAPPTIGESGRPYKFRWPLLDEVPEVDLADSGLAQAWLPGADPASETQEVYVPSCVSLEGCDSVSAVSDAILAFALKSTIPKRFGERHDKIFEFVLVLKASPIHGRQTASALEPVFRRWFELALPHIRTEDWKISWDDFRSGWARAKSDALKNPKVAVQIARNSPLPACAANYNKQPMRDLIGLCSVMQKLHGDNPFFLGQRTVAEILDLKLPTANRYVLKLRHDHILKVAKEHGVEERTADGKRMAYEYRYIGDQVATVRPGIEQPTEAEAVTAQAA